MPFIHFLALLAVLLVFPASVAAGDKPETSGVALSDLAAQFADAAQRAADRHNVVLTPRTLSPGPGLTGSEALPTLASLLNKRLGDPPRRPAKQTAALPMVLDASGGLLMLTAPLVDANGQPLDIVAASIPLTPAVEAVLAYAPMHAAGFTLRRVGSVPGGVLDAAAGDVNGDDRPVIAALTSKELRVMRFRNGRMKPVVHIGLPTPRRSQAVRDPRGVVTVRKPGIYVRLASNEKTALFALNDDRLTFKDDRDEVVLASRNARFEPGTNQLRFGRNSKSAFYAVRAVHGGNGARMAMLDLDHTLHLLDRDLKNESARVEDCGAGFAVADFLGDNNPEALCSGTDIPTAPDRVRLVEPRTGRILWTSPPLPGGVRAIVPLTDGGTTGALLFVDDGTAGGTTLWWLRRGY